MRNYPFYIAIFLLASFLLALFLVWPKYQELTDLNSQIADKNFELQSQKEYFQELQNTAEELKKYEAPLAKIESALPPDPSLPDLLHFIQETSSQSGLSLEELTPEPTSPGEEGAVRATRVNLAVIGDYTSFKNFLSILEQSARLIDVENIFFGYTEEAPFTFKLILKVYSY